MLLSLIIPAFNESSRIVPSLESAFQYLTEQAYDSEVLVVDDGSSDDTVAVVTETLARLSTDKTPGRVIELGANLGKGAGVRAGMLSAKGEIRIFTDADFSTPVKEVEKVIPLIKSKEFDVVIGSRAAEGRRLVKKHQPFYRETMGKFYNLLVQAMVFRGIKDTQCGFKGFSAEAAQMLFSKQKVMGFSFDVEILYLARINGFKVKEIAVEWYNDERTTVGALSDSLQMFRELVRIKRLHRNDA